MLSIGIVVYAVHWHYGICDPLVLQLWTYNALSFSGDIIRPRNQRIYDFVGGASHGNS